MRPLAAAALLAVVTGCSPSGQSDDAGDFAQRVGSGGPAQPVAEVNAQPVVAPSGKAVLTPLAASAPKAMGAVARTCAFVYQGRTLLVAGADDAAGNGARGVLVVDGQEVALPGAPAGAKQDLSAGVKLAGNGYRADVTTGEGAALRIAGPQGETMFNPGTWSCAA